PSHTGRKVLRGRDRSFGTGAIATDRGPVRCMSRSRTREVRLRRTSSSSSLGGSCVDTVPEIDGRNIKDQSGKFRLAKVLRHLGPYLVADRIGTIAKSCHCFSKNECGLLGGRGGGGMDTRYRPRAYQWHASH